MIELENAVVYHGSNLDVLPTLPDNSVDSIVTDPPYELGFMGKSWDSSGIAYSVELWQECMRVLKPGGHLLAFGGSRTWHRLAVAIEDAGFEMRDSIAWLYGSGFPKSLDVSKAIDKAAGAEREVVGSKLGQPGYSLAESKGNQVYGGGFGGSGNPEKEAEITAPATPEALKWQGWGTALKPAFEPIVVARKPLIGTVAQNVLTYGTGGLNIDGSRISAEGESFEGLQGRPIQKLATRKTDETDEEYRLRVLESPGQQVALEKLKTLGRWPANIILDPYTAELLDEQSGQSTSRPFTSDGVKQPRNSMGGGNMAAGGSNHNDSGGASRFFYVAKASKRDRNEGLDHLPLEQVAFGGHGNNEPDGMTQQLVHAPRQNFHPTVKPTSLMEYLIKLVTPEGGTVLDPFTGSGSTGKAALLNGFQFIGIELTEEYLPIIEGRLRWANEQRNQEANQSETKEKETLF